MIWRLRNLYFFIGISIGVFLPYISILLKHDGVSNTTLGLLMSMGILAAMIAQPLWGWLSDKFGIARFILVVVFLVPASFAMFFNAHVLFLLALINVLYFTIKSPQFSVVNAYTLSITADMGSVYGKIRYYQSVGFGIGGYIAGLYLGHFSVSSLWILFSLLSVIGAFTLIGLPPMPKVEHHPHEKENFVQNLKVLLVGKQNYFLLFLLGAFFMNQTLASFNTYFVVVFHDYGGAMDHIGWGFIIASVGNIFSMILAERLTNRFGTVRILILASLLYALRWFLQIFITSPDWVLVLQILHGSFGLFFIPAVHYVANNAPVKVRATAQAIFGMVAGGMGLSTIVGNSLDGYLLQFGGPSAMYSVSAVSAVLATACFFYILFHQRRARIRESYAQ
ncbi:MFS transporter [Alicyclobacillus sp. SO9]|uniref:MFS transporter n=1 Tax=Alicyclobacillus sp. SO9 TaxID=2665646 RepID=UPI0018E8D0BF|nr:MFS transporter [Alicyclobacillus sp. SO9]QQE77868.1 MFS transporter [Alicyclobacillus sp. SO9]